MRDFSDIVARPKGVYETRMDNDLVCLPDPFRPHDPSKPWHPVANPFSVDEMREAIAVFDDVFAGIPVPEFKFNVPPSHIVYFVGAETGPVKIGWTQQPIKARLVCIQNGSPFKLHVLATQNAPREKERWYHRYFAKHRLHGEWFERASEIQDTIDRLNGVRCGD